MNRCKQGGMGTRAIVVLLVGLILASVHLADAQQPAKIPRIGLVPVAGNPKTPGLFVEVFRQGLQELGYVEGKNILIEYRYPGEEPDRVQEIVTDLVQLEVDVLTAAIRAACCVLKDCSNYVKSLCEKASLKSDYLLPVSGL